MRSTLKTLWMYGCLVGALLLAAAPSGWADDTPAAKPADESPGSPVPVRLRDSILDYFAPSLMHPQNAEWSWDPIQPYLPDQTLVCGWVLFQNSLQRYVKKQRFYALIRNDQVTLAQINDPVQDTSKALAYKLKLLCDSK